MSKSFDTMKSERKHSMILPAFLPVSRCVFRQAKPAFLRSQMPHKAQETDGRDSCPNDCQSPHTGRILFFFVFCVAFIELSCLCVVARNAASQLRWPLLHVLVFLARSQQIIYLREVVAHRPYGSSQTDRIRLPYAGRELSARRSCQGASAARKERGTHGCLLRFNSGQSPGWR